MVFDNFATAQTVLLWSAFGVALVMGAVVNKTNFCTMGAVSDWVNMGDTGRLRSWLFAIAVATLGLLVLEATGVASADGSFPPYRGGELRWAENLLGGLMFGIGMTLASGCGNKTLVRIGGGNLKSLFVLLIIGIIAYFMVYPFPGTDKTLFSELFNGWIRPLAIKLPGSQDLGTLVFGSAAAATGRLVLGALVALGLMVFAFLSADFRGNANNIVGGLVVGLAVVAGWYVSGAMHLTVDGDSMSLQGYVQQWDFLAPGPEGKPAESGSLAAQSFTFINPMGQSMGFVASGFSKAQLTFGIMALAGVIAGSFLWSVLSRGFRIEWFASVGDFLNHLVGAVLMGFGGVLAMGCTIGQGVTGVSTLAVGSYITLASIVFGCALTMKVSYYRMVYEDEASFGKALVTALVDLRLLPSGMRKLEAV